jgi:predicted dehydrogenase
LRWRPLRIAARHPPVIDFDVDSEQRQTSEGSMTKQRGATNRRTFLKATSAAGLAAATARFAAPAILRAGDPPSEQTRIGMIGVGNQGSGNLRKVIDRVVAVCEVDSVRLDAAQAAVKKATSRDCAAYGDYRKLLDRKDIDAVVVTTPDHWHALPTIEACQAGKDVYCEKPLTLFIAEGQAMVAAARKHNRIVQTGSQQRSDERFRRACELVRSGRIGKVHTVKCGIANVNFKGPPVPNSSPPAELDYEMWLGPAPQRPYNEKHVHYNFRFFWDYSGGQQTNWGAHHLDIAQWGLGMDDSGPVSVEGTAKYEPTGMYEVPMWSNATYQYADGVTLYCGHDYRGGTLFEGDKGSVFVNRKELVVTPTELGEAPLGDGDVHLYESASHFQNWFDCIKSRELPICDVAIGHRSATVCHLGNIALRTGRKIAWDPKSETIINDSEAAALANRPYRSPWVLPV